MDSDEMPAAVAPVDAAGLPRAPPPPLPVGAAAPSAVSEAATALSRCARYSCPTRPV